VRKALIIASEVRSGSTFVAESIAYHFEGIFGDVLFDLTREHFAHLTEKSSSTEILAKFNSLYLGHQGWVATKIMCAALSLIVREARKVESLRQAFFGPHTHWIIVRRRMKVRQAVSLAHAKKTGDWHVYSGEQSAIDKPIVTLKETEDALRSILLSDVYLETLSGLIASDKKIEVFYEDFVSDPSSLIEHVYDVLGVARPSDGVKYKDLTKIRRGATDQKQKSESDFVAWFPENYYPVQKVSAPASVTNKESPQLSAAEGASNDYRLAIVNEFTKKRRSIQFLAKKHGIERSLISYWIAKQKHGELDERSMKAEESTYLKGRISMLERQVDELKRASCDANSAEDLTKALSRDAT
jgi:LPS sulfotransferase NodH/transposase-like protein